MATHEDLGVVGVSDRFSDESVLSHGSRAELEMDARVWNWPLEGNGPLPQAGGEARRDRGDVPRGQGLVDLPCQRVLGVTPQGPFCRGKGPAAILELPLRVLRDQARELLRGSVLRAVTVPNALARIAHGLDERDLVAGAHNRRAFREVLDEFTDEEVLSRIGTLPGLVAGDVRMQALKELCIGEDGSVLPTFSLKLALASDAQQHHGTLLPAHAAVRKVPVIAVAVTVRDLVVLHDHARTVAREDDVRDVRAFICDGGVDLLHHAVAGCGELCRLVEELVDVLEEEPLERIAQFVCRSWRQEPGEHVGQLLLMGPVVHHAEDIELLSQTPRQGRHKRSDHLLERTRRGGHAGQDSVGAPGLPCLRAPLSKACHSDLMTVETQGHLFVVHGDLTKLSWDAVLIPCDQDQAVSSWWFRLFDTTRQPRGAWGPLPEDAALAPRFRGPEKREPDPTAYELVDTVSPEDVEQLAAAVGGALERLVARLPQGAHAGRIRRLVAMPVPGTGHGVYPHRRGAVVRAVVPALVACAERLGVDVALVVQDPRDYAAIQGGTVRSWSLSKELQDHADRLGQLAGRGELSVFIGAGASVPLGLPSWEQLVNSLLHEAGEKTLPAGADEVAFKAAAQRAKDRIGQDRYARRLEKLFATKHHALSHGLIASLRLRQNVTTNFDTALEAAMSPTHGEDLRVMAHQWATTSGPWLLKLHGTVGVPPGVVLTVGEYASHAREGRPLYGLVQGLLMTSHVLFVGFSLTDSAYLDLAGDVAKIYATADAGSHKVATAMGLSTLQNPDHMLDEAFHHVPFRGRSDTDESAARTLEVFLDRLAWTAARTRGGAHQYLLDERYEDLVEEAGAVPIRDALNQLREVANQSSSPVAARVREAVDEFGAD